MRCGDEQRAGVRNQGRHAYQREAREIQSLDAECPGTTRVASRRVTRPCVQCQPAGLWQCA
eukprot:6173903-Pleurochrysis_carterae.AAC.2